ncbi:bifunctional riboflavin kinase/FAD synthetase [Pontibacter sp. JAM-7]|uniref:bifunctional riboflavin kinase/FAD synthetase n=1 Tax=Pontibacter sp. JAM-7 TaxID=3366581 RepID=UPI003AF7A82B
MELIRGLHNLRGEHRGCVATIGNFDGVHMGHRRVLQQVKDKAAQLDVPSVVIVFEPQPREFFAGADAPPRLTRFTEKFRLLEAEGIDRLLCLSFNERLRSLSADAFVQSLLLQGLDVQHFVVGDDFRFGCDRSGDYAMLKAAGEKYGFTVVNTATCLQDHARISSSRIREALAANDFDMAVQLLGRPYRVTGRVMQGQQLGRQLGVPTANVRMHRYPCPLRGVYAVCAQTESGDWLQGVANIGIRPTVGGSQPVLEAHLFGFNQQIYRQLLSVEFKHFIRPEQKFSGLEALKQQIFEDIEQARRFFAVGCGAETR